MWFQSHLSSGSCPSAQGPLQSITLLSDSNTWTAQSVPLITFSSKPCWTGSEIIAFFFPSFASQDIVKDKWFLHPLHHLWQEIFLLSYLKSRSTRKQTSMYVWVFSGLLSLDIWQAVYVLSFFRDLFLEAIGKNAPLYSQAWRNWLKSI